MAAGLSGPCRRTRRIGACGLMIPAGCRRVSCSRPTSSAEAGGGTPAGGMYRPRTGSSDRGPDAERLDAGSTPGDRPAAQTHRSRPRPGHWWGEPGRSARSEGPPRQGRRKTMDEARLAFAASRDPDVDTPLSRKRSAGRCVRSGPRRINLRLSGGAGATPRPAFPVASAYSRPWRRRPPGFRAGAGSCLRKELPARR